MFSEFSINLILSFLVAAIALTGIDLLLGWPFWWTSLSQLGGLVAVSIGGMLLAT